MGGPGLEKLDAIDKSGALAMRHDAQIPTTERHTLRTRHRMLPHAFVDHRAQALDVEGLLDPRVGDAVEERARRRRERAAGDEHYPFALVRGRACERLVELPPVMTGIIRSHRMRSNCSPAAAMRSSASRPLVTCVTS